MISLAHTGPRFARQTGVAPGTSTIYLPNPTVADLKGAGLGLIMPPSWPTGRTTTPPGLPGTTTVLLNREGGAAGLMGSEGAGSYAKTITLGALAGLLAFGAYRVFRKKKA